MAYGRSTTSHGSWFQEQMNMINSASESEISGLCDTFDNNFKDTVNTLSHAYGGLNVMKDAKKMLDNPEVMQEYKTLMLDPICNELRDYAEASSDNAEKVHLESVADQLSNAWDESVKSFLVQESYNVSNYLTTFLTISRFQLLTSLHSSSSISDSLVRILSLYRQLHLLILNSVFSSSIL